VVASLAHCHGISRNYLASTLPSSQSALSVKGMPDSAVSGLVDDDLVRVLNTAKVQAVR